MPMDDGFDDEYKKGGNSDLSGLNIRKIPTRKTAVALKESNEGKNIPRIAAAGRGNLAEKILELAFENGIKVREDSDLAEMLVAVELDSPIPSEAFMAVGEILSYLYKANGQDNPFDTLIADGE
ncbi:MAG: EscU/YscU/HrcU family type III secretion system export apparatus switch protein [Alphaproteobacteria bacterium]|nr:EscU/YscU/HrcU family type III secretion system export apparatus switch protein [Alphaproteobacteria bacterium]